LDAVDPGPLAEMRFYRWISEELRGCRDLPGDKAKIPHVRIARRCVVPVRTIERKRFEGGEHGLLQLTGLSTSLGQHERLTGRNSHVGCRGDLVPIRVRRIPLRGWC